MAIYRLSALTAAALFLVGCSPAAKTEAGAPKGQRPPFDAARAFDLLKKQVAFGPRVPDTPGHAACATFIQDNLKPYADSVRTQSFTAGVNGKQIALTNIIAQFNPDARRYILLAAHWDTRPTADCEVIAEKRRLPIPGANDGASGVAVLLELARTFAARKPAVGVVMVFFDGEDYGPEADAMFLGSARFASELSKGRLVPHPDRIAFGILLDMVGDADLKIAQEKNSVAAAPDVVKNIWSAASALGYDKIFLSKPGYAINDDHLPLIKAGVKCVDIIDFEYGPWHTLDDTPDKCSADSLKTVGEVVADVVYQEPDN